MGENERYLQDIQREYVDFLDDEVRVPELSTLIDFLMISPCLSRKIKRSTQPTSRPWFRRILGV